MTSNKINNQEPVIILIGGAAGTSKTTNGNIPYKISIKTEIYNPVVDWE